MTASSRQAAYLDTIDAWPEKLRMQSTLGGTVIRLDADGCIALAKRIEEAKSQSDALNDALIERAVSDALLSRSRVDLRRCRWLGLILSVLLLSNFVVGYIQP